MIRGRSWPVGKQAVKIGAVNANFPDCERLVRTSKSKPDPATIGREAGIEGRPGEANQLTRGAPIGIGQKKIVLAGENQLAAVARPRRPVAINAGQASWSPHWQGQYPSPVIVVHKKS